MSVEVFIIEMLKIELNKNITTSLETYSNIYPNADETALVFIIMCDIELGIVKSEKYSRHQAKRLLEVINLLEN